MRKFLLLISLAAICFAGGWITNRYIAILVQPDFFCRDLIEARWADCFVNQPQIDTWLQREAATRNLDWRFAKAVLIKESHYVAYAVSGSGAVGLMQLMPRQGSYTTGNYNNMMAARRQNRDADGLRWYKGRTARQWSRAYQADLWDLLQKYRKTPAELYKQDSRFDPLWNIQSGVAQLAREYHRFRDRRHSAYSAMIYAAAAYNAGPGAVVVDKKNRRHDRIPVNKQTEYYTATVLKIYRALVKGDGRVRWRDRYVLLE
ncbi:MAG: transglycosylase SLT domain-containing protein [Leptospiraceae bacterium]|nr:transglycosylase SLT domain-containing protein [Leptospiraceae bacterium]